MDGDQLLLLLQLLMALVMIRSVIGAAEDWLARCFVHFGRCNVPLLIRYLELSLTCAHWYVLCVCVCVCVCARTHARVCMCVYVCVCTCL